MEKTSPEKTTQSFRFLSARFGEIEIDPSDILTFEEGLLGFNHLHRYVILQDPEEDPFLWLQSLDESELAFIVVDPFIFFPNYEIQLKTHELALIQLKDLSKAKVLTIVTVPDDPMQLTTNLRGPIVVNSENKVCKQYVLIDDRYTTKHLLVPTEVEESSAKKGK
jgi:flagellar assembly factor FliW